MPAFARRFPERIIPALAGNTIVDTYMFREIGDHPRSRGEYYIPDEASAFNNGSSPLSRGILARRPGTLVRVRIIPALAGNTSRKHGRQR